MQSSICKSWKMTEGTIKAVPIPTVPEYPECSRVSLRPEWLKPVTSSTFSYRGWKALLPEMKNNLHTKPSVKQHFTYSKKERRQLELLRITLGSIGTSNCIDC